MICRRPWEPNLCGELKASSGLEPVAYPKDQMQTEFYAPPVAKSPISISTEVR